MKFDEIQKQLLKARNIASLPHFDLSQSQSEQVRILPNELVSPAKFKLDTKNPNTYYAHPTTIRAMKKNIFVAGQELFEDLQISYTCETCKKKLDVQFWHFCPYCEASFNGEISKYIKT